jgi:hypothetical protein
MSKTTPLGKVVSVRLTDKDHSSYMAKVLASGMKPSRFLRDCILADKTEVIVDGKPLTPDEIRRVAEIRLQAKQSKNESSSAEKRRLLYLFNKAGNNINQLAKAANVAHVAGTVSEDLYREILKNLEHISGYMKASLKDVD